MKPGRHDYRIERFTDEAGEPRFSLIAPNGENMFTSEGYSSAFNRNRGIGDILEVFGCAEGSEDHIIHLNRGPKSIVVCDRQETM